MSYIKDNLSVTAWNDNNIVMIVHNNSTSDPVRCERQVGRQRVMVPQPKAIADYNQFMNGVDLHDQLRKKYACGRPSKKYRVLEIHSLVYLGLLSCERVPRVQGGIIEDHPKEALHPPGFRY